MGPVVMRRLGGKDREWDRGCHRGKGKGRGRGLESINSNSSNIRGSRRILGLGCMLGGDDACAVGLKGLGTAMRYNSTRFALVAGDKYSNTCTHDRGSRVCHAEERC